MEKIDLYKSNKRRSLRQGKMKLEFKRRRKQRKAQLKNGR